MHCILEEFEIPPNNCKGRFVVIIFPKLFSIKQLLNDLREGEDKTPPLAIASFETKDQAIQFLKDYDIEYEYFKYISADNYAKDKKCNSEELKKYIIDTYGYKKG
jgi:hypothetical protein